MIGAPLTPAVWPKRGYAWYVVTLLTLAYALAILDRVSIGLLIVPIQSALHINDTEFGLLQGMAFSLFYSLLGLPLGMVCDKSRRVPLLITGIVLWSIATIGCAFASNFHELFIARMLVGVGEAALVPCAASLIADYFEPGIRPKAYGAFTTGSTLGSVAAFALSALFLVIAGQLIANGGMFSDMQSWQIVFILCGMPGILLAIIMIFTMREPRRQGPVVAATGISLKPIIALFRRHPRALLSLMLGTVLNLVCVYAIIGWFPALFIRVHEWSASETGYTLAAVGLPISLFAAVNSGWVIVWITKRGHTDAPMIAATVTGLSMALFGTLSSVVPYAWLSLVCYAINSLFVNWNISSVYSGLSLIVPNDLRGQVMALHNIASGLIALTLGNFIVGLLSDTVFNFPGGVAWSLGVVFFTCGLGAAAVLASGRGTFRAAALDYQQREAARD
ncbi:MAG: MFS transporter [Sphingobium sp.]